MIKNQLDEYWWMARSLDTGREGLIPSNEVVPAKQPEQGKLTVSESLELIEFIIEEEDKMNIPTIQKIQNESCSNAEKAALLSKAIEEDPILLESLRKAKDRHERGETFSLCGWDCEPMNLFSW